MTHRQEQNVPKLRFPGFEGALKSVKLGDVATFSKGKGISKSDIDPDGALPCIRYGELYTVYDTVIDQPISKTSIPASNLRISKGNEVLVPASGEDAKDIATAVVVKQAGVALGGDLNIIQSKNDGAYLASYLSGRKRMKLASMAQGNSVVHLYPAQLKILDLHLPTLPEQRKIAGFLSAVDEKIAHLSRKKALFEDYKKGCMQQLFSQKIRFKDDDGNDFPDWEEKRLGKIATFSKGKGISKADIADDGENLCVRYGELYTEYREHIGRVVSKTNTPLKGAVLSKRNDILMPTSDVTPSGLATASALDAEGVILGGDILIIRSKEILNRFFSYFVGANKPKIMRLVSGVTVYHIYGSDLATLHISVPHLDEQRKIADFLSALDRKIDLVVQELTLARSFKAGLLQQMFV